LLLTKLSPVTTLHGGPGGSGVSHYSLTGREPTTLSFAAATALPSCRPAVLPFLLLMQWQGGKVAQVNPAVEGTATSSTDAHRDR